MTGCEGTARPTNPTRLGHPTHLGRLGRLGRPYGLDGPLGTWRPLDRWVAGYALLTGLVLALGLARGVPGCGPQAVVSLAALLGARGLAHWTRDGRGQGRTFLRLASGPALYWVFYHQIPTLWAILWPVPLDGHLAALEVRLWGTQPSLAFQAALPWRGLSELFCAAYFSYYLFVPAVGITALARRGYAVAERIILATTGCFFSCYTLFWLLPTVGPHFWFPPGLGPQLYRGYLFNHLLFSFTSGGEIRGGAFPSSHIAVAVLLTLLARRATPALFPGLALATALLLPGVVYLRAHYLLDVPAGMLVGLIAYAWAAPGLPARPRAEPPPRRS